MEVCGITKKNLGTGQCNDLPQILRRHILTGDDFVATKAEIESRTFWQEQIALGNAYYFPAYSDVPEYIGTESTFRDNPVNYSKVIAGRYRWRVKIEKNLCFHKAANSHSGRGGRVWIVDGANRTFGTYVGDNESGVATYAGFSMDLFDAENLMFNDGTNPTESPFVIALSDPNEINNAVYGAYGFNTAFIGVLQPLTDVVLEIIEADASEIVLQAYLACDGTPVSGLVLADYTVVDDAGDPVTFAGGTESPAGTYTLTSSAAFASGDVIDLVAPTAIEVYPLSAYEGIPVTVTIPFPSV